mmetsp:Transcript_45058/g.105244  ORF Transcript_45058/g.105244 Transcript_45058/m.105244 type:complete len:236 (+) Transcript_45058:890-1597(+)
MPRGLMVVTPTSITALASAASRAWASCLASTCKIGAAFSDPCAFLVAATIRSNTPSAGPSITSAESDDESRPSSVLLSTLSSPDAWAAPCSSATASLLAAPTIPFTFSAPCVVAASLAVPAVSASPALPASTCSSCAARSSCSASPPHSTARHSALSSPTCRERTSTSISVSSRELSSWTVSVPSSWKRSATARMRRSSCSPLIFSSPTSGVCSCSTLLDTAARSASSMSSSASR